MDWKEQLMGLQNSGTLPQGPAENEEPAAPAVRKENLRVVIDKRHRKGKTATIVEGFLHATDEEVEEIARTLKQRLGTGGSSRGGEILLQGDWREKTLAILKELGHNAK